MVCSLNAGSMSAGYQLTTLSFLGHEHHRSAEAGAIGSFHRGG